VAVLDAQTLQRLLPRIERGELTDTQREGLFWALKAELNRRCAEDGLFWLQHAKTRDEADVDQAVKSVPLHEPYIAPLWQGLVDHQVTILAKSRQMFVSWEIALFCVWWARYKPNQAIYIQMQGWPDAVAMTCMPAGGYEGRMQFIENHLPDWMRLKYKASEGRMAYPNGSIIQALAGGANQIRSKTYSLYVGDEFAFCEEQDKIWTAVAPLIQKGSKAIIVSTPNGVDNQFSTLWHGYPVGQQMQANSLLRDSA
jgi:hypothetical protein